MTALRRALLSLAACLGLAACEAGSTVFELTGSTMGTSYSIAVVNPPESTDLVALEQEVSRLLATFNSQMSTYDADSELSRFNARQSTDWQDVSARLCNAVVAALEIADATNGAFDITVGPLVNLWGFGPAGTRSEPPGDQEIAGAHEAVGMDMITTDCADNVMRKNNVATYVDLSAFAKGYAVDLLAELLDEHEIDGFLIEIGGELRAQGVNGRNEAWRVAIERPDVDGRMVQRVIRISDNAIATSGDYRNYFVADGKRYSHTIDPGTGRPVEHQLAAVSVIEKSAARADALATALMVLGPENGKKYADTHGIAALFLEYGREDILEHSSATFSAAIN